MSVPASIVIGLGYGDEGKGLVTDYCSSQFPDTLTIRFNGGQQAGHTVCLPGGRRHVFSSFGAGTWRGAATYWSAYCTVSPGALLNEYQALRQLKLKPVLYLDRHCPVTTHYDVLFNRLLENQRGEGRHGSCGMGFGQTIARNEDGLCFSVSELLDGTQAAPKLLEIRRYYIREAEKQQLDFTGFDHEAEDLRFLNYITACRNLLNKTLFLTTEQEIFSNKHSWQQYVFEGAQGVLLDMDYGHFPHVTRSHTSSKNALAMISRNGAAFGKVSIFYVSRVYQTRHGEGPMNATQVQLHLKNNEQETNVFNAYQGNFKVAPLDTGALKRAIAHDEIYSKGIPKNLVLTCADQLNEQQIPYFTESGELLYCAVTVLPGLLDVPFHQVLFSRGPDAGCISPL